MRGTMADEVYTILRHEITHNILKSGSPLIEEEIAERLGVSRTPVRDCMQRLAAEGLIVSRRRRWIVKDHSPEEIVEIYQVRAALESYAASLAAQFATESEREQILALGRRVDVDPRERAIVNERFHDHVTRAGHNARLAAARDQNTIVHFDASLAGLYTPTDLEVSAQQHIAIAEAIAGGDAATAGRVAREHVEFSAQLFIEKSQQPQPMARIGPRAG